jgi:uncharacterized protein
MILYLREFETFPVQTCLDADPTTFKIDFDGVYGVKKATIELVIQKSGEEFFSQGTVKAILELECVRCLKHFESKLYGETDFIICSKEHYEEQRSQALDDEDYVFFKGENLKADVADMVRQAVMLAVPMMPLCNENCEGLCPQCGVDRNLNKCRCGEKQIDERWEGLRDLLSR